MKGSILDTSILFFLSRIATQGNTIKEKNPARKIKLCIAFGGKINFPKDNFFLRSCENNQFVDTLNMLS